MFHGLFQGFFHGLDPVFTGTKSIFFTGYKKVFTGKKKNTELIQHRAATQKANYFFENILEFSKHQSRYGKQPNINRQKKSEPIKYGANIFKNIFANTVENVDTKP